MTDERRAAERLVFGILSWLAAIAAIVILVPLAWKYLSPFILALPIAGMLQRPAKWLEKKLPVKAGVPRMVLTVLFILAAIALLVWFMVYGIGQITLLVKEAVPVVTGWINDLRSAIVSMTNTIKSLQPEEINWITDTTNNVTKWLTDQVGVVTGAVVPVLTNAAAQVPYAILYANFLFLGIFFISKRYDDVKVYLPGGDKCIVSRSSASGRLLRSAIEGLGGFLKVQLVYGLITFAVSYVFWKIVGVDRAVLIAFFSGLLEMIPLIGNAAVLIPWSVIELVAGNYPRAIEALALYLLLQLIRRTTEPKLLSQNTGISPLLTLIGMFAGLIAGGIVGLIGGPVLMNVLASIARGHYLNPILQDARELREALRRRWHAPLPTDIQEDAQTETEPEAKKTPAKPVEQAGKTALRKRTGR